MSVFTIIVSALLATSALAGMYHRSPPPPIGLISLSSRPRRPRRQAQRRQGHWLAHHRGVLPDVH